MEQDFTPTEAPCKLCGGIRIAGTCSHCDRSCHLRDCRPCGRVIAEARKAKP